jgi:DnaJ-class molecular chaperone
MDGAGQVVVVKDKGMPQHQYEGEYGNLYVELQIVMPATLSAEAKEGVCMSAIGQQADALGLIGQERMHGCKGNGHGLI